MKKIFYLFLVSVMLWGFTPLSVVAEDVERVQHKLGSVKRDGATISFDTIPTEGNLLVVLSGHRFGEDDPEITSGEGWTRHIVKATTPNNRLIAMWSKVAEEDDQDVTIDWKGYDDTREAWVILQEFSGAEEWLFFDVVSAESDAEGTELIIGPTEIPESDKILAIAGVVFRGDIENPVFTNQDMDSIIHYAYSEPQNPAQVVHGSTAFISSQSGDFAWETTSSWDNERFASGILALFQIGEPDSDTSVPSSESLPVVSIYPNPVQNGNGKLNIMLKNQQATQVQIFDVAGRLVKSTQLSQGTNTISVDGLLNGLYILRISSNQETTIHKIVVER